MTMEELEEMEPGFAIRFDEGGLEWPFHSEDKNKLQRTAATLALLKMRRRKRGDEQHKTKGEGK